MGSLVGHVIDRMTVTSDFCEAARSGAGLSWGDKFVRAQYILALCFDFDSDADAADMAGSQSSCATSAMKSLHRAGVDGSVKGWRGQAVCDPLRAPYAKRYDGIAYLGELGRQTGARRLPGGKDERPDVRAGSILKIGGGSDGGGADHILQVVDVLSDGTLVTVEGGKVDPLNPKPSPKNCIRIADDRRELVWREDGWWCRDAGSAGAGRRVRWWFAVADLPMVEAEGA